MIHSDQRLQPVDLLKIYGDMEYEWHLAEDRIEWQGPFSRLLSPDISLETGNSFGNLLTVHSFNQRTHALAEAYHGHDPYYSLVYSISLPNHERTMVLEEGMVIKNGGVPKRLSGYLRFKDLPAYLLPPHNNFSGYDKETGLPEREIMLENLLSIVDQSRYNRNVGAYIALTMNGLSLLTLQNGVGVSEEIFRQLALRLRLLLRKTDIIGRVSSTCLGIILPDCPEDDLATILDRIMAPLHTEPFKIQGFNPQYLNFSAAGQIFSANTQHITKLMEQAEKSLFDTQADNNAHIYFPALGAGFLRSTR